MDSFNKFIKTTIVGGLIFLIPVILLVLVLKHAMGFAAKVAKPIAERFPVPEIGGAALVTLVAIVILIAIAFLAGLVSRTSPGRRIAQWIEDSILSGIPAVKDISKPSGAKPGLVYVHRGRTLQLRRDPKRLERVLASRREE